MSGRFRTPSLDRNQGFLAGVSLDDLVGDGHPVRRFEKMMDSSAFEGAFKEIEAGYSSGEGRPAYSPRRMVSLLIYGMLFGMRSSRTLESACVNRLDVRWLMQGDEPEFSTICGFRRRHAEAFEAIFAATVELAVDGELVQSKHLAVDGTKIQASASKWSVHGRPVVEAKKGRLKEFIKNAQQEFERNDQEEAVGSAGSQHPMPEKDPEALKAAHRKLEREIKKAEAKLKALEEAEKVRDQRIEESETNGSCERAVSVVSLSEPEARVMKDKEDRSLPCYAANAAVDTDSGIVTAVDVDDKCFDGHALLPMVDQSIKNTKSEPSIVSADSAYSIGPALKNLEDRNIATYIPESGTRGPSTPEREAVLEKLRSDDKTLTPEQERLVMSRGFLNKDAFVYDKESDTYICPNKKVLRYVRTRKEPNVHGTTHRTQYRPEDGACDDCPLRSICAPKDGKVRMLTHDEFELHRKRVKERLNNDEGRSIYRKRTAIERAFSWLKAVPGVRRFLHRGLAKVKMEFQLACAALNMRILMAKAG